MTLLPRTLFARRGVVLLAMALLLASCAGPDRDDGDVLRLAVSTTVRDSGLLDELLPPFEERCGCTVDVIATGSGRAMVLGESGDVDVLLVHSPAAEKEFMAAGHGVRREAVMYNSFLLLGPPSDPAGTAGRSPALALRAIAESGSSFVSRGDDSGTHRRELDLWAEGGGRPRWDRYIESGRGMGTTLMTADQLDAYLLSDRGTYLRFRDRVDLRPPTLAEGEMHNPYGAIVVNPDKHSAIRADLAHGFVDFLTSSTFASILDGYRIDEEPLFYPAEATGSATVATGVGDD